MKEKEFKKWAIKGIKLCDTVAEIYFICDLIKKKIIEITSDGKRI